MEMEIGKILPPLEKGIATLQGRLVRLAEERVTAQAFQNSGLEESGPRNLLDVAKESPHVAVVTNFIRYQVGRDASPSPTKWATEVTYKEKEQSTADDTERTMAIGEWVADDIEHTIARDLAAEVLEHVEAQIDGPLPGKVRRAATEQAAIRLTRSYLGHLLRAFVVAKG
jgi:hypothetical protein